MHSNEPGLFTISTWLQRRRKKRFSVTQKTSIYVLLNLMFANKHLLQPQIGTSYGLAPLTWGADATHPPPALIDPLTLLPKLWPKHYILKCSENKKTKQNKSSFGFFRWPWYWSFCRKYGGGWVDSLPWSQSPPEPRRRRVGEVEYGGGGWRRCQYGQKDEEVEECGRLVKW